MSRTIRSETQYTIESPLVVIDGNLQVQGTTSTIESTDTEIVDRIITLNKQTGTLTDGVAGGQSGIEVDRGNLPNVLIRYNEDFGYWEYTNNGSVYYPFAVGTGTGGTGLENVVEDLTPQLGGTLDVNGFNIVNDVTNGDVSIVPNGTGAVEIDGSLALENQSVTPNTRAGQNVVYADTPSGGGSGVYFANTTTSGELVSKQKSIVYSIIFS